MSTDMQIAIVGVVGTLAGTIMGWLLNTISQKGRLHLYICSFEDSFQQNKHGCMIDSSSIEETRSYSYKLVLDIYNSSGATKILRNLTVVFSDGKNDLYKSTPDDDSTGRNSGPAWFYDEVGPINIPPKSIFQISLHDGVWKKENELDFIWKTQKVYLTYTDEKNRLKKVKIKTEIYRNYFINHKAEEKTNG